MPKIIIHSPEGTFDGDARRSVVVELTDFALDCEALPRSPFVKSTVWTYFVSYARDAVFMGDQPAYAGIVSAQVFTIEGGLDQAAKARLIAGLTEILNRHSERSEPAPIYVVVHEVPEENWGIFGKTADLAALRASDADAPAL